MVKKNEWKGILKDKAAEIPIDSLPKASIIIPTLNCSQSIAYTLESVLFQDFLDLEVIIIDAGSTDRTIEIVKSFFDDRIRICSVAQYNRYEMLNKGISLAKGTYINVLFPGDFYLYLSALKDILELAVEYDYPHLIYGACLLRDSINETVSVMHHPLSIECLKRGEQPTSLQSSWFHEESFRVIGKFSTSFSIKGGFDLFCRFRLYSHLRVISTKRVLVDYSFRAVGRGTTFLHFKETLRILTLYFGYFTAFKWLFIQKDILRFIKLSFRSVKAAFLGKGG